MDITFSNTRIQKLCSSHRDLQSLLGAGGARKAAAHLASLRAANSLDDFRGLPGRCHELKADRAGELALSLPDGKSLIFEPAANPAPTKPDGGVDWRGVQAIRILEITDYH